MSHTKHTEYTKLHTSLALVCYHPDGSKGIATCKNMSKFTCHRVDIIIHTLTSFVNTILNANLNTMSLASLAMVPRIHSAIFVRFVQLVSKDE